MSLQTKDGDLFEELEGFSLGTDRPASAQVFAYLRARIIRGDIPPGTTLSEARLCVFFRVSRQPVREALVRLSAENLVQVFPQRGSVVTRISVPMIYQAQLIREAVEVETVTRAIRRRTAAFAARLEAELKIQQTFRECWDVERFFQSDQNFHRTICEQSGTGGVWESLEASRAQLDRARQIELQTRESLGILIEQHTAIYDAIMAGDTAGAVAAMRTHLRRVIAGLPDIVAQVPDHFEPEGLRELRRSAD